MDKYKLMAVFLGAALFLGGCIPGLTEESAEMTDSSDSEETMDTDMQDSNDMDDETEPMGTSSTDGIMYMEGNENAAGYLARPEGDGPYPALILIHEWWGLNENIKDIADQFAEQGYVALAIDMYDGESTDNPDEARELATSVRGDMDGAFANLNAGVAYLEGLDYVDSESLASVGWCFGGGWAYQMAKNDLGVDASIMYYGQFNPEDDLQMMRADILGHFGEEDASIAIDDVEQFQANLETLDGNHAVYIYPNAGHAFANEDNEDAYNQEAAELAWERTMEFLDENL